MEDNDSSIWHWEDVGGGAFRRYLTIQHAEWTEHKFSVTES